MPTNHHYEKGNDKLNFSAHNAEKYYRYGAECWRFLSLI